MQSDLISSPGSGTVAGYCAIAGALSMFTGAAFWAAGGADLWVALSNDEMAAYLADAAGARSLFVANTSFWVLGVLLMGTAGTLMAGLCIRNPVVATAALVSIRTAVPMAIISFITMLSLVIHIAPDSSPAAVSVATVVGWIGARVDDLATILIVGVGPFFLSVAGYHEWVPNWLRIWGLLAGLTALLSAGGLILNPGHGLTFLLVPVGLGWMIAAGVVLTRRKI